MVSNLYESRKLVAAAEDEYQLGEHEFFTSSDENVDGVEPFVTFIRCRVHETVDLMLRLVVVVGWVLERGGGGSLKCLRSGGC